MIANCGRTLGVFLLLFVTLLVLRTPAWAQVTDGERRVLDTLDSKRVRAEIRHLSEGVVKTRSGQGAGTAVAGSDEERLLGDVIAQQMSDLGLQVHKEAYPVRQYTSAEVTLTANGRPVQAVSLHAAGGTWGTRDGVPYARGNENSGRRVRAALVDVGDGLLPDYARTGGVRGKVVLVRRGEMWPVYQILEAAHQGAAALLMYDFPGAGDEVIKQDSMWYHEQLPTVSIAKGSAKNLQQQLKNGSVEIALENRVDSTDGTAQNVLGTIRGSEFPDEWLMVSAHFDRWWQSANDNCAGVATMLEFARLMASGTHPRRSVMFLATSGEEAGVEATEFDWLAGSHAFAIAHPEITRRLVYGFNIDLAGWTAKRGTLFTTPEIASAQQKMLSDLGLGDRVKIHLGLDPDQDSWNLGTVGGGGISWLVWGDYVGYEGNDKDAKPFGPFYHTQLDVYHPEDFDNLISHLRIGALSLLRMDAAVNVPLQFTEVADWVQKAFDADARLVPADSYADARGALAEFRAQAQHIVTERAKPKTPQQAAPLNAWLMRTRKDLLPWLSGLSSTGVRTSPYAQTLAAISAARAAAEKGDNAATIAALEQVDDARAGWETPSVRMAALVSPEVSREERLYGYTSGDWSSAYDQKPRPLGEELDASYRRLKNGGTAAAEVAPLRQLEDQARGNLSDALFLVAGKLRTAADALREAPLL